jgi:hypothetical protein
LKHVPQPVDQSALKPSGIAGGIVRIGMIADRAGLSGVAASAGAFAQPRPIRMGSQTHLVLSHRPQDFI